MRYEIGKQYEMNVIDIRKDSAGYNYIALQDDDPYKEYRVYNILKCQYESLPKTLYVIVKSIDGFGKIKLRQDEGRLNQEHYKTGKLYAFEVTDVKEDYNTNAPYYVLEDDFSSHHYYFQGEQKYKIGDSCILEVEGFTDKGYLMLKEVEHYDGQVEESMTDTIDDSEKKIIDQLGDLPILDIGDEGYNLEIKSSIAFPPGCNGVSDIDRQLFNILKELTAFMNTDGGTLYIGIHDKTKKVIGIEGDYSHLNDGEDDYNGCYKEDNDGYELKIRNAIDRLCPSVANSLISFDFETLKERTYCKITIAPAKRPIFLSGIHLYLRQGNRIKLLKSDEITFFITDRMTLSIRDVVDADDINNSSSVIDMDELRKIMKDLINERHAIPVALPKPKSLGEIDYWIIWYQNGSWKRSREKSNEGNVHIQIPVYKNMSDPILTFCYDNARINTVKLSDFRKGANLNVLQKIGWCRNGNNPQNIFLMHATDFIVGYSVDSNGIEHVKVHSISDYSTTASASNQGSPFLPSTSKIISFAVIGAEHKNHIAHLIVTKARRTYDVGTPLTSVSLKNEIDYLEGILS